LDALLKRFRSAFEGQAYKHRDSTIGDKIAEFLLEDLLTLGRSPKFSTRARAGQAVLNTRNRVTGRNGRRGDGTFGDLVPTGQARTARGYSVLRGPVANVEVGVETKILATKMIAQIDRVLTALKDQADTFLHLNTRAIKVAIVGVNHASAYTGYEGRRRYSAKVPPGREAAEIIARLNEFTRPRYDELVILPFKATNQRPFLFEWVDEAQTRDEYTSALVRLSSEYEARF
jgi:hypothetical protein